MQRYRARVAVLQRAVYALGFLGIVLRAAAGAGEIAAAAVWVPVVTTVSAALAAHVGATRYQHQVIEFPRTADQLAYLRGCWRGGALRDAAFVEACQDVTSVENQAWMTRWREPDASS